jgi:hypothetical protein
MKRYSNDEHQTAQPAKAAKMGEAEGVSPSPNIASTERVANVEAPPLSNNRAFLGTATIPPYDTPEFPFCPPGFPWPPYPFLLFEPACQMPSQSGPVQEMTRTRKRTFEKKKPGDRYSLSEKQALIELWIQIQPENAKHGWKKLKACFNERTKTNHRSERALVKEFEAIRTSKDEELAPLREAIERKELKKFQKKQILTSVAGRVGSIYPSGDKEGEEKENENPIVLKNRVKRQQRMDVFKKKKEEEDKRKEELHELSKNYNDALRSYVSDRKGLHGEVARLKIQIAKMKNDMGKDLKKILEFIEKKGNGENK